MEPTNILHLSVAFGAAFLAGAINSVAGGGTLISFPVLLWLGLPAMSANATSTVAIWPGSLGSIWGFRKELKSTDSRLKLFVVPGILGGAIGAMLLRLTPAGTFDKLVPFLVLFATVLFSIKDLVQKKLGTNAGAIHRTGAWFWSALTIQFLAGIYGGYFGAGLSILMLSILGVLGMTDMLEMNALTSLFSLCINGVASLLFIFAKLVHWPFLLVMWCGAILGGYGAAGIARKVGKTAVRRFVIFVGLSISVTLIVRMLR